MIWNLTDQELQSVMRLPAAERYSYFIKKAADEEIVWSLRQQDGWALLESPEGQELVPVWPHKMYAEACAVDQFHGYEATPIELDTWLQRWIPGMMRDARQIAVFPTPGGTGPNVAPERIKKDLEAELKNYE
jgi:hypothetical protein